MLPSRLRLMKHPAVLLLWRTLQKEEVWDLVLRSTLSGQCQVLSSRGRAGKKTCFMCSRRQHSTALTQSCMCLPVNQACQKEVSHPISGSALPESTIQRLTTHRAQSFASAGGHNHLHQAHWWVANPISLRKGAGCRTMFQKLQGSPRERLHWKEVNESLCEEATWALVWKMW